MDHRGIVLNDPVGALVCLGLGRAYATQGDTVKAKGAIRISSCYGKTRFSHSHPHRCKA